WRRRQVGRALTRHRPARRRLLLGLLPSARYRRLLVRGRRLLNDARAQRRRREVHEARAVVVPRARRTERDLVAVLERLLPAHALGVDVRAVQAPEVAEDELPVAQLDDAVLLRDDLVEELDG